MPTWRNQGNLQALVQQAMEVGKDSQGDGAEKAKVMVTDFMEKRKNERQNKAASARV